MKNKRRSSKLGNYIMLSMVTFLAPITSAHAATWCGGRVSGVLTDAGGRVYVYPSFRNDWVQICNLATAWKGVSIDICKSWLATVTALRLTGESTVFHYNETFTCNAIASYDSAYSPAYISINVQ